MPRGGCSVRDAPRRVRGYGRGPLEVVAKGSLERSIPLSPLDPAPISPSSSAVLIAHIAAFLTTPRSALRKRFESPCTSSRSTHRLASSSPRMPRSVSTHDCARCGSLARPCSRPSRRSARQASRCGGSAVAQRSELHADRWHPDQVCSNSGIGAPASACRREKAAAAPLAACMCAGWPACRWPPARGLSSTGMRSSSVPGRSG